MAQSISLTGPARVQARNVRVPGDISSAAFFIAAAGLLDGSALEISGAGINGTRVSFVERLRQLGFQIDITDETDDGCEPVGRILTRGTNDSRPNSPAPFRIEGSMIPQLIDELPLLAIVGSQIEGGIEIRNARELRVKESDRIAATVAGLRAMGAEVEEFADGLHVSGKTQLHAARIDSRGDHRIAMAFAVAGLLAKGETEIDGADCVAVSFPEFFELLASVSEARL
jgi:3-phosphoshikimate 1-carboxyvinyltransferase